MWVQKYSVIHQAKCKCYWNMVDTEGLLVLLRIYVQLSFLDSDAWSPEVQQRYYQTIE